MQRVYDCGRVAAERFCRKWREMDFTAAIS
jgi:hypothetical protein